MRRLRTLALSLGLLWAATSPAAEPIAVTILCDNGYPPYSYGEDGEAKGLYSDILRAAFARMPAYQVSIRPVPWRRGLAELERGTSFALYPPYYRPQERPYMDYSRPLLAEKVVIYLNPATALSHATADFPSAYLGLNIGLNDGFSVVQDPLFEQMRARGQLLVSYARDNRSNLLKLSRERIDAYINDRLSILWTLQQLQQRGELPVETANALVEGPTLSVEHGHLGVTNRDQGRFTYKADFMRSLDVALAELERTGVIAALTANYSGRSAP